MAGKRPGAPDWVDVDWRFHQRWLSVGGRLVNLVDLGSGPASPIVFVHGVDGCWTDWLEQLVAFAGSRRVVALDLPGFGWSEPAPAPPGIEGYAACVGDVCSQLGIERAVLAGHSMGGLVVADLALGSPGLAAELVLAAPAILWSAQARARPLAVAGRALALFSDWAARHWELALRRPRLRAMALSRAVFRPERLAPETAYEML
jgi:pimeloyl-ACP methyl ester carboxylesterase